MTLFYYIAANRELPTGSFGKKGTVMTLMDYVTHVNPAEKDRFPMKTLLEKYAHEDKFIEIYETEEDAAGLYITGPLTGQDSSRMFKNRLVYQVNPDGGSFEMNDELKSSHPVLYQTSKKCLTELFNYLAHHMETGEEFELYSCWADGLERFNDMPKKELDLVIELTTFTLGNEFEWKERQMIRVKKY